MGDYDSDSLVVSDGAVEVPSTDLSMERDGLSVWDGLVVIVVVLLLTVYFPPFFFDGWTPRMALVVGAAPLGVTLMAWRCVCRDRPTVVLVLALCWSTTSAILSDAPRSALLGFVGRDLSVLTVVGAAGLWEIGRLVSDRGRELIPQVFVVAAAVGAGVGVVQVLFNVESGELALLHGRPTGLVSNPVYFGALCAAGAAAASSMVERHNWKWSVPSIAVSGAAVSLSGSRVALLAALIAGMAMVLVYRTVRVAVGASLLGAALVCGVAIDRTAGAGRNAASRLAATDSSGDGRLDVWHFGLEALADRPLQGYGLGQFRPAVQARFTTDFVRSSAPDERVQAWFDPHNVGMNLLVSVGVVGAGLLLGWALIWARRVRGPLAWALVALFVHWLLQPLSLFTVPLAMLIFAVAAPGMASSGLPDRWRRWTLGSGLLGVFFASGLIVADLDFSRSVDAADGDVAASAARWFYDDPGVADVVAQVYALDRERNEAGDDEIEWRRRATRYQPDRPLWWSALAEAQFDANHYADAEKSIRRALALQPHSTSSQRVVVLLALRAEDGDRLQEALDLACELGQSDCSLEADTLIEELRDAAG